MPTEIYYSLAVIILILIVVRTARDYYKADKKKRVSMTKVFVVVGVISILMFTSVRYSGLSEVLFPSWYNVDQTLTEEERQDVLEEFIDEDTIPPFPQKEE